ncbi:DUF3967 domain-containing protein [Niallia taxi]|uniref:DUF3967 domain-containing protein n=1 Tax=Niallia taxi TaxID=2499688 RepID=A0A3S2TTR1_9BACI|nr:DUF3967 domain-containing protein [Niallia taxi]RVT56443.1 DUF3967 domain-containing protein [Niallia taxi]
MTDDIKDEHIIMSPSEVATLLDIKESTLRKYALLLKDAGYHFDVNEKGQRWYYNRDVIAFKKLMQFKSSPDMTLEQSANAVVAWFNQSNVSLSITEKNTENRRYDDDIKELKEIINQQNNLLLELAKKMDQQQKYIDERLEQRDQKLMESLRENQEVKKALLSIAAAQEENKKSFFGRLFKR